MWTPTHFVAPTLTPKMWLGGLTSALLGTPRSLRQYLHNSINKSTSLVLCYSRGILYEV